MSVLENSCEVLNAPHTVLRCGLITMVTSPGAVGGLHSGCYLYNNKIIFPFPQYIFFNATVLSICPHA